MNAQKSQIHSEKKIYHLNHKYGEEESTQGSELGSHNFILLSLLKKNNKHKIFLLSVAACDWDVNNKFFELLQYTLQSVILSLMGKVLDYEK